MNENKYFIKSIRYNVKKKGITIKFFSRQCNIEYKQFNEYLNFKRNFSEQRKIQIAEKLGSTYLDMMNEGRELSKNPESVPIPKPSENDDLNARIRKKLYEMTEDLEEKELRKLQSIIEDEIEKKRLKEEIEQLKRSIERKKA